MSAVSYVINPLTNDTKQVVGFWRTEDTYGIFSQWAPSNFILNNQKFTCAEQWMMYNKALAFGDKATALKIMATDSPKTMKALGKQVKGFTDDEWDKIKYEIVVQGSRAKFGQNPELRQQLLNTGNATLAELSPYDAIWGVGTSSPRPETWKGQNLLGKALMQVRDELRST